MDRIETYVGQSILEWNFSKPDQNKMVALGKVISALLGTAGAVNGLACTQQSVPSMFVNVAPGEIYQLAQLEATVCGTLPADTAHSIMKQGIALDTVVVPNANTGITAFTAPGTTGQSINYLIQATYADLDVSLDPTTGASPVVLPFYNSSNPQSPYQGPNGSGATSNTFRKGIVSLQVKAGIAAATGSQTTPAPDSGYIGLWVVTVAFGQTSIINSNIATYSGALFLSETLQQKISTATLAVLKGVQLFASSGSFTVPAGVTKIFLSGVAGAGGGGGSGGATSSAFASSGGGGGGASGTAAIRTAYTVTPGQTLSITIGAGGGAGTAGTGAGAAATNGGDGGATTVTGTGVAFSLAGGAGGKASTYSAGSNVGLAGGAGGSPSGNAGGAGIAISGYGFNLGGSGGAGGSSPFGQGGGETVNSTAGVAGTAASGYGAGGGGGSGVLGGTTDGKVGAVGTGGIVFIEW